MARTPVQEIRHEKRSTGLDAWKHAFVIHQTGSLVRKVWSLDMSKLEVTALNEGIDAGELRSIAEVSQIPLRDLALSLNMPLRTLQRKRQAGKALDTDMSEKVLRGLKVWAIAEDTLGSPEKAKEWLTSPIPSLDGKTPISMLGTSAGERMVINVLGAIEYGIYL